MAQDLLSKKKQWMSEAVAYAAKAASLTRDIKELVDYFTDNGFSAGGSSPISQADIDAGGGQVNHLTPAILAAFVAAITNVALTPPQRTTMRTVANVSVPNDK